MTVIKARITDGIWCISGINSVYGFPKTNTTGLGDCQAQSFSFSQVVTNCGDAESPYSQFYPRHYEVINVNFLPKMPLPVFLTPTSDSFFFPETSWFKIRFTHSISKILPVLSTESSVYVLRINFVFVVRIYNSSPRHDCLVHESAGAHDCASAGMPLAAHSLSTPRLEQGPAVNLWRFYRPW